MPLLKNTDSSALANSRKRMLPTTVKRSAKSLLALAACAILSGSLALHAQSPRLTIDAGTSVSPVSPTLYGLMTEEINFSYDGGLYAEMVRNRAFLRNWDGFENWLLVTHGNSQATIDAGDTGPSAALPKSLKLVITASDAHNQAGIANTGYWGMAVRPSTTYSGSFYALTGGAETAHPRLIADESGATLAEATVDLKPGEWQQYHYTLHTGANLAPGQANHLEIIFDQPGTISFQLVSLFPPTYEQRENGNRPDLMKMLAAMNPHFLRLPGGNYLEGDYIRERFDWKKTIGPLVDRPTHRSPWMYQSSDGMGLLEFLEWCQDLHIDPLLAVYAGYSLRGEHVLGKDLEPFVQDALDEIEYVTGDVSTKWGAERAKDGHPEPFPLHYVEIGNEDWLDKAGTYPQRYPPFATAIRAKYPQLKIIATTPVKGPAPDVIDDHYYLTPEGFFDILHKYDTMDRNGPKIFIGEWATRTGSPTPDFGAALGDAAWMTSMERNSDLIVMASYAPLFTNVNPGGMQWPTDLIGYDALHSYGSPSYYAQVLFSNHLGDHTVKSSAEGVNSRFFWSATVSTADKMLHLKLVNAEDTTQPLKLDIPDAKAGTAKMYTLHAAGRWATNSIDHPENIHPVTSTVPVAKDWNHAVPGNTIEVLDIPLN